jgi:hypothetical protein
MAVAVVANVAALHHCNSAPQGVTLEPDCGGLRGSTQHFILERKAEVASSTPAFAMNRRS